MVNNNSQVDETFTKYEQALKQSQLGVSQSQIDAQQQEINMQEEDKGMISEQLDLSDVLERIHNLLRGYVLKKDKTTGRMRWSQPDNNDMIILSEYGINYIMGAVQWYLNKNTLLSNYDDKQIDAKMEDLATTLADDVFMEYDKMFLYPTLEDCKAELKNRIQAKVDIRKFAAELIGKEVSEEELENKILIEMEDRIEKEMVTIREQKIKNKLKRFESLMRFLQDTIHSAYQRAWKGQERSTLRTHMHISETKGGVIVPNQQGAGFNPLGILRKR